jgi:copper transport protein
MAKLMVRAIALCCCLAALLGAAAPADVAAHAALARSDPAAGTSLAEPPAEIRLTFTEPLESAYSGAELLDGAGQMVPNVTVAISAQNAHEMVVTPAAPLPDGNYTVAWRTLSAADGHTLQGYFGIAVGVPASAGSVVATPDAPGNETLRAFSRGLALLGLAALLALAPVTLAVLAPADSAVPSLDGTLPPALRRYAVLASVLAALGSLAALAAQAATIAPAVPLTGAIVETLGEPRYGQLWLVRLVLIASIVLCVALALWGRASWRRPALGAAALVSVAAPLPFSLISHAAAQEQGRAAAVAVDALHLLAASVWVGGLFMLVAVLLPALRPLPVEGRRDAVGAALPRFSIIGVAAWTILTLSGLYASWLQVGSLDALRTTPYGQSLALKLLLLIPALALAAFHFILGKGAVTAEGARRFTSTIVAEALIVVAVVLVVGRLIGLEPAREVLSARTPPHLVVPLAFATGEGARTGQLTIAPGAAGPNTFLLQIDGASLPDETQGVLRFTPPNPDIGQQEITLPMQGPNAFRVSGSELALPGDWQVEVIVRAIGAFSWSTAFTIPVRSAPPPAPEVNPAPLFAPAAIAGLVAIAIGAVALAVALAGRAIRSRRWAAAAVGAGLLAVGGLVVSGSRLPAPEQILAASPLTAEPASEASPSAAAHQTSHGAMALHASPVAGGATPQPMPGPGDVVQGNGFTVELAAEPAGAGPVDVAVILENDDGAPLEGARVVVLSDMPEMGMGRTETPADETEPGRYAASFVPLGMPGEWHLAVRISPRGEPTQVFTFAVVVP